MKLSKLAKRMANDLHIFEDGLSIQDFIFALEDRDVYTKLIEKGYISEEIKQVYDELIYKTANF